MEEIKEVKPVVLSPGKTAGRQAYRIVLEAVRRRSAATGEKVTKTDFCNVAKLSRTQLHRYRNGDHPAESGILKLAAGLKAWDLPVEIDLGL